MHHEFGLDPEIIYLNHAAVAPWPRRTEQAVVAFAGENRRLGATRYPEWLAREACLRQRLAALIGAASPDDIALMKNTSEALSVIAEGFPWRRGDNLVSFADEFPSNRLPWQALSGRGVETRLAPLNACDPEQALLALCDARTRLVSVSSVQYANGLRIDLEQIGAYCRRQGIRFCVDAIQSLGALPFAVDAVKADFVVADGHKWLLGPEGLALFYSRPSAREELRLVQFGWHMVEAVGDFDAGDWRPARSARRFECGSPNQLGIHALDASLSLLLEIGIEEIARRIEARVAAIIDEIDARGFELLTPRDATRRAGIVTFRVPGMDSQALYERLMAHQVICACRGGGVRFSPHFHTAPEQIRKAFTILSHLLSRAGA